LTYSQEKGISNRVEHVLEAMVAREWGTSFGNLSMKGMSYYEKNFNHGYKNYLLRSYSQTSLIEKGFRNVLDKIKLKTPVTKIDYRESGVIVTDAHNQLYECDICIVAVPISILQKEYITFLPDLSEAKKKAIKALHMDNGSKLIMKFNTRFWKEDMCAIFMKGMLGVIWSPSVSRKYAKDYVLTALITGDVATKLAAMSKDEVKTMLIEDLTRLFGDTVEKSYMDHMIYDWSKEEFIEGAYTYPTMSEGGDNSREIIGKSIGGKIYFAGEALSKNNYSSIGGALESSMVVVQEITSMGAGV